MEEAFYAVQRNKLQGLYDYLNSDYKTMIQEKPEMEYYKEILLERIKQKESEDAMNVC